MKVCFLTSCIYKDFLFTNLDKTNFKNTSWDIINISDEYLNSKININNFKNNFKNNNNKNNKKIDIYKSRYIKFMGWEYLKDVMKKEYDIIFYCDVLYSPNKNVDWNFYFQKIKENGLIQRLHPVKPNIYKECSNCHRAKKDTRENMKLMANFLKEKNVPEDVIIKENTSFGYDPNNQKITSSYKEFWDLYINLQITYRDQPLWNYILWKNKLNPYLDSKLHKLFSRDRNLLFLYTGKAQNNGHQYV